MKTTNFIYRLTIGGGGNEGHGVFLTRKEKQHRGHYVQVKRKGDGQKKYLKNGIPSQDLIPLPFKMPTLFSFSLLLA